MDSCLICANFQTLCYTQELCKLQLKAVWTRNSTTFYKHTNLNDKRPLPSRLQKCFLTASAVANKANATQYTHQRLSWQVQTLCSARMTLEREWQSWYRGDKSEWQNNQFFSSSENELSLLYIHLRWHKTKQDQKKNQKGYDLWQKKLWYIYENQIC